MLRQTLNKTNKALTKTLKRPMKQPVVRELSVITSLNAGTATACGLSDVQMNELVLLGDKGTGLVHRLSAAEVGIVILSGAEGLQAGDTVRRTHRVLDVPVGEELLGRVITPLGQPLDDKGPVQGKSRWPIERPAAAIMDRAPVQKPLQTGIKVIDAFTPIGCGQRELILGDRQTGKTALALDTILNQKDKDVICIYCAIGQRSSQSAHVIDVLKQHDCLSYCIVVVADGADEAGAQYIAPYAATTMGEYFMEQGKDVLVIYDDLSAHARAYRQMSLLLKSPPGREAYPGDIFYIHARLLERATHLSSDLKGGSLTALPIVSTEGGNLSAYIPTNIISITDGQIYLSTPLFQKGVFPAVDTGRSVSRVGGDAQPPALRSLVGPLKLVYAQFEELESFAKFGTQLDDAIVRQLQRGQAIRFILQQGQYAPVPMAQQVVFILAVNAGLLDNANDIERTQLTALFMKTAYRRFPKIMAAIETGQKLNVAEQEKIITTLKALIKNGTRAD